MSHIFTCSAAAELPEMMLFCLPLNAMTRPLIGNLLSVFSLAQDISLARIMQFVDIHQMLL